MDRDTAIQAHLQARFEEAHSALEDLRQGLQNTTGRVLEQLSDNEKTIHDILVKFGEASVEDAYFRGTLLGVEILAFACEAPQSAVETVSRLLRERADEYALEKHH